LSCEYFQLCAALGDWEAVKKEMEALRRRCMTSGGTDCVASALRAAAIASLPAALAKACAAAVAPQPPLALLKALASMGSEVGAAALRDAVAWAEGGRRRRALTADAALRYVEELARRKPAARLGSGGRARGGSASRAASPAAE
jgi:hypothetical protein